MIHELKTAPKYFEDVASEQKTFEVRKNDRPFAVGDYLALNEFDAGYTGHCMLVQITYILDNESYCKEGYCILGIKGCAIGVKNNDLMCDRPRGIPVYGGETCGGCINEI